MIRALMLAALLLTAGLAEAADEDTWQRRVGRVAPEGYNLNAPVLCYCPQNDNRVGHLQQGKLVENAEQYSVWLLCVIPLVNFSDGDINTNVILVTCDNFALLPK